MISAENECIATNAKRIYSERLKNKLESTQLNRFVAIEPTSGEYFLGDSFSLAVAESRKAHPDRISFVIRIGHDAAIHLGGMSN